MKRISNWLCFFGASDWLGCLKVVLNFLLEGDSHFSLVEADLKSLSKRCCFFDLQVFKTGSIPEIAGWGLKEEEAAEKKSSNLCFFVVEEAPEFFVSVKDSLFKAGLLEKEERTRFFVTLSFCWFWSFGPFKLFEEIDEEPEKISQRSIKITGWTLTYHNVRLCMIIRSLHTHTHTHTFLQCKLVMKLSITLQCIRSDNGKVNLINVKIHSF